MNANPRPISTGTGSHRSRWAAVGAAIAITLGAGGLQLAHAGGLQLEEISVNPSPESFRRIQPCRLQDSRVDFQVGAFDTPIGPGESRVFDGVGPVGECVIPKTANAIAVNAIGIDATDPTFLTLHSDTATLDPPNASNLNVFPGQPPTPNFAIVPLDSSGDFVMYNAFGEVDTVIDVVGYTETTYIEQWYGIELEEATASQGLIGTDPTTVVEVELDTWGKSGRVVATSSINVLDATEGDSIRCSITTGPSAHDDEHLQTWVSPGAPAGVGHLAGSRVLTEFEEGSTVTVRLVCDHLGASGPGAFNRAVLTAMLVPDRNPFVVKLP